MDTFILKRYIFIGPEYFVVNGSEGVIGTFQNLDTAKIVLNEAHEGRTIKAQVNDKVAINELSIRGGENMLNGTNTGCCSWICITKMHWLSQQNLKNKKSKRD